MATFTLPGPRSNLTAAGIADRAKDIVGSVIVATGDFTGGASEDLFTLSSHGLVNGQAVFLLHKSAVGVVTGKAGTRFFVKVLSANTFQLCSNTAASTIVENTADGTASFLVANPDAGAFVRLAVLPNLIAANGDFTGGATEDLFTPVALGTPPLEDTDTLVLVHKAAAGVVTSISAGTTVYAKSVTATGFELAATSGGADIENSADGLAIFLKTS